MFEFFFWLLAIYVIVKAIRIFLRFFVSGYKGSAASRQKPQAESKYKDVEEVDFIEVKEDKNSNKEKT